MNRRSCGETSRFCEDSFVSSARSLSREPVRGIEGADWLRVSFRVGYVERSFEGMPVVSLYSAVISRRRDGGIGTVLLFVVVRRMRRSQGVVARGFLSRIVGWITIWRGWEATMILILGDCLRVWRKDWGVVDFVRVRRWRVAAGMIDSVCLCLCCDNSD